jgi:hypothetical protein
MSIRLTDRTGRALKVSALELGVLHYAVTCAKPPIFDEDVLRLLRYGGVELELNEDQVRKFLSEVIRPTIPLGQRMTFDFFHHV